MNDFLGKCRDWKMHLFILKSNNFVQLALVIGPHSSRADRTNFRITMACQWHSWWSGLRNMSSTATSISLYFVILQYILQYIPAVWGDWWLTLKRTDTDLSLWVPPIDCRQQANLKAKVNRCNSSIHTLCWPSICEWSVSMHDLAKCVWPLPF